MFLLNSCLGLFSAAWSPRRPFSRSYGAILPSSLAMLLPPALGSSPHPPVSVYGTGMVHAIAAFPGTRSLYFPTCVSVRLTRLPHGGGFASRPGHALAPVSPFPAYSLHMRPRSSGTPWYRNLHLLSIGYASPPRLRPRLTQGRSALPWNPWIFGPGDSHPRLATHSGILPSRHSTCPHGHASPRLQCSPTGAPECTPKLRWRVSAPDIFGAGPLGQ